MVKLWTRNFEGEGIDPRAVMKLSGEISWEHPPSMPQAVAAARELQKAQKHEQAEYRLPTVDDPDPAWRVAAADSPARLEFLAELERFNSRSTTPIKRLRA